MKELILNKNIKLVQDDCLNYLKNIEDNSIDLVLTDPPYNLDFSSYNSLTDKNGRKFHNTEKLEWDLKTNTNLKEIAKILFKEFDRIVKESGSIIIFAPQEWAYYYYEPAIDNHFDLKCQIIWLKNNPIPQIRHKNYRSAHENIVWFGRFAEKCPFTFNFTYQKDMKNVFEFPILGGKERLRGEDNKCLHPTQKPLKLIQKLIEIHSNRKDTILDCFMGSGTTGVICARLERKFIGIEISPKYFKIAEERIRPEVSQNRLS